MTKNEGKKDRIIRLIIGILLLLGINLFKNEMVQWVLFGLSLISIVTAIVGWCGVYKVLGIDTRR